MPEGAPRFESFESSHSPEKDRSRVESSPVDCGVRIKIREWPAKYGGIFREGTGMSVRMRCVDCPAVRFDETLWSDLTDTDLITKRAQLRQDAATVFLKGCRNLSEPEREEPSSIPLELR